MTLEQKTEHLRQIISGLPPAAIAFSGGVDSSLLADFVHEIQGEEAVALTIDSMFTTRREMAGALRVAREIGIRHQVIAIDTLENAILSNPADRCYHCKKFIFGRLLETAREQGRSVLLEGSNRDDLNDYRPGMKAVRELGVRSPLLEAGLDKREIRDLSRERGLSTWNHPSMACLASRIPYRERITPESLQMVELAESFIRELGFDGFRVRKHGDMARIELSPGDRPRFLDPELMGRVSETLKSFGFQFVTLDLDGYRTGSLNQHQSHSE